MCVMCVVWDKSPRHDIMFNKMEKNTTYAARIKTFANNYASNHLFYIETGWDKSSKRREKQSVILSKIKYDKSPMH